MNNNIQAQELAQTIKNSETTQSLAAAGNQALRMLASSVRVVAKTTHLTIATGAALVDATELSLDKGIEVAPMSKEDVEAGLQEILANLQANREDK